MGTTQGPCVGGSEPEAGLQRVFILKPGLAGTGRARRALTAVVIQSVDARLSAPACHVHRLSAHPAARPGADTRAPRDRTRGAGPRAQLCSWQEPEGRSRGLDGAGPRGGAAALLGAGARAQDCVPGAQGSLRRGAWPARQGLGLRRNLESAPQAEKVWGSQGPSSRGSGQTLYLEHLKRRVLQDLFCPPSRPPHPVPKLQRTKGRALCRGSPRGSDISGTLTIDP